MIKYTRKNERDAREIAWNVCISILECNDEELMAMPVKTLAKIRDFIEAAIMAHGKSKTETEEIINNV